MTPTRSLPRALSRRVLAVSAATALLLAACSTDDTVAELQADLDAARQEAEAARAEYDRVAAELDALLGQGVTPPEPEEEEPEEAPSPSGPTGEEPERPRTAAGLVDQLRLLFGPGDLPDEWEPGSTDWEPFDLPDGFTDETFEEIGLLAVELLRVLDGPMLGLDTWESTVRALPANDGEQGHVAVLSWGFADDALQGRDVRVTVTRGDAGWQTVDAEVRHHCRRGVTDDGLCT